RLGVSKTPIGVTCLGTDVVSDLVPKRHVDTSPIGGVGETLTLIFGHIVADQVQGDDCHSCCLHDPVYLPGMVFQDLSLPDTRQRLSRQVLHCKRACRRFLAAEHCCKEAVTKPAIALIPETHRPFHAPKSGSRALEPARRQFLKWDVLRLCR